MAFQVRWSHKYTIKRMTREMDDNPLDMLTGDEWTYVNTPPRLRVTETEGGGAVLLKLDAVECLGHHVSNLVGGVTVLDGNDRPATPHGCSAGGRRSAWSGWMSPGWSRCRWLAECPRRSS